MRTDYLVYICAELLFKVQTHDKSSKGPEMLLESGNDVKRVG